MSILRLGVVLEEVAPRVSRTLMVPSDLRLDRLHLVLQAAVGWENQHLYNFDTGPLRWSLPDPRLGLDALPANKATLQGALAAAGSTPLHYTYDFGDNWRHRLTADLTDGPLQGQLYPPCWSRLEGGARPRTWAGHRATDTSLRRSPIQGIPTTTS